MITAFRPSLIVLVLDRVSNATITLLFTYYAWDN